MKDFYMGIDIGTSGVRSALFDVNGRQAGIAYKEYPMICTQPGMAELDPFIIFSSLIEVVKDCIQKTGVNTDCICAIGLSTQLFSLMAVDSQGYCLTNVLTWADNRSFREAEYISQQFDCTGLYRNTGCRVQHPMYPLSKILWLKKAHPDLFSKVHKFVSIKEYILYLMFSEFVIDYTDASTTACYNIHTFRWNEDILSDILGIRKERFGDSVECTFTLKGMKKEYADAMGIRSDIPVVVGSGDGILANLGCGVFNDTAMSCTIGTSGALRIAVPEPLLDPRQRTWCYCFAKDTWVAGGAINNGGIVLKWLRDNFREQFLNEAQQKSCSSIYKLFDEYAGQIPAGSEGLTFLPLLTGERSPNWNASARGVLYGLDLSHDRRHIVKAAMEGVMYRMYSVYEAMTSINDHVLQIRANGGYTASDVWLQIQADIFGKEIAVAGVEEAAVFGAAYIAMVSVGAVKDIKQFLPAMEVKRIISPIDANTEIYRRGYQGFKDIYQKVYGG